MTAPRVRRIHPQKFALWVGIISMTMLFSAFTSAYIVRKSAGNWLSFPLPDAFFYSTGVILSSSILLHMAYKAFVKENYQLFRGLGIASSVLGIVFLILQYQGWIALNDIGVFLHTNQSSSFLGVMLLAHSFHLVGGLAALSIVLTYALRKKTLKLTPKRQLRMELVCTFWHFVDILWLYIIVFILIQQ
ncbi:MAG: cytochrome oxidase subunit III [Aureispira sp.]|nr:cytochrome oxidase subunit III [Aureispira sp.]